MPDPTTPNPGEQPQQAPFGASPATGPSPNRGYEAAAIQGVGVVIKQLEKLIPLVGSASDIGKDVLKALNMLTKHVPPGTVSPAAERNQLERMQLQNAQQGQQMQQLRAQGGQPGMGGGGGAQMPPQMPRAA